MTRHLLVIGAQRCGTTYLHDLLAHHPQIAMARPARPEPKVFLSSELSERGRGWYVDTYFAHAMKDVLLLGEKSTSYLEVPAAAGRAAAMLGDPRILVQLRDPVARALSHWAFSTDSGFETRPAAEALEANLRGPLPWDPERTSVSPFAYLERGRYVDHLSPWLQRFGSDLSIHLLEDLVADPDRIRNLYVELGVDPTVRPTGLGTRTNESRSAAGQIPAELHLRLREYFAASDAALADLLGRALPWTTTTARLPEETA